LPPSHPEPGEPMNEPIIIPAEGISEALIYDKLVQLIRLCAAHGIRVEPLMTRAIEDCDAEPPFCR
jgi:hypothetical protein